MRLLVVEDDPRIAEPLAGSATRGIRGRARRDGSDRARGGRVRPRPARPRPAGHRRRVVCRQLRERSDVPIIVVTARGDEIDRVVLLELGADDYVVKPFGFRELVARIRAVMRRTATRGRRRRPGHRRRAARHRRAPRTVTFDGTPIALTPKEYDLLACLARDPGAVLSREQLLDDVWDRTGGARRRPSTCTSRRCARSWRPS